MLGPLEREGAFDEAAAVVTGGLLGVLVVVLRSVFAADSCYALGLCFRACKGCWLVFHFGILWVLLNCKVVGVGYCYARG